MECKAWEGSRRESLIVKVLHCTPGGVLGQEDPENSKNHLRGDLSQKAGRGLGRSCSVCERDHKASVSRKGSGDPGLGTLPWEFHLLGWQTPRAIPPSVLCTCLWPSTLSHTVAFPAPHWTSEEPVVKANLPRTWGFCPSNPVSAQAWFLRI